VAVATAPAPPATRRAELVEALRYAGLVFLCVRAGLALLSVLGPGLVPSEGVLDRFGDPTPTGWAALFRGWERKDATFYLSIIDAGYAPPEDPPSAFFPVYPSLARLLRPLLGGSSLAAALVVSHAAFLAALVVLHRLTAAEFDRDTARRAVLYLAVSPVALFFFAAYTESLFLLLALVAFWGARRQRWLVAGLAGALASGTRSAGVLLALPIALELLAALRAPRAAPRWRTALAGAGALALVPTGLLAYLAFWWLRAGDPTLPLDVQRESWGHQPLWPWQTLAAGVRQGTEGIAQFPSGYLQLNLLLTAVGLVLAVWLVGRVRASYWTWTWASLLLPLATPIPSEALASVPRYLLVLFPLTWALARISARLGIHDAVVAASAALLGLLTVLHLTNHPVF